MTAGDLLWGLVHHVSLEFLHFHEHHALTLLKDRGILTTFLIVQACALRRALNRTLILPRFWAWCEMDQVATVLETCRKDGGDQVLPFQTPADYLLSFWALPSSPLSYRSIAFLTTLG